VSFIRTRSVRGATKAPFLVGSAGTAELRDASIVAHLGLADDTSRWIAGPTRWRTERPTRALFYAVIVHTAGNSDIVARMPSKAAITPEQERAAIEAVTSLDWTPILSPLPARSIAQALAVTDERAAAILNEFRDRELIESCFEHPGKSLAETDYIVVNHRSKWARVEPV
jgi:hypothetical protein